jgi:hypothetical protein
MRQRPELDRDAAARFRARLADRRPRPETHRNTPWFVKGIIANRRRGSGRRRESDVAGTADPKLDSRRGAGDKGPVPQVPSGRGLDSVLPQGYDGAVLFTLPARLDDGARDWISTAELAW